MERYLGRQQRCKHSFVDAQRLLPGHNVPLRPFDEFKSPKSEAAPLLTSSLHRLLRKARREYFQTSTDVESREQSHSALSFFISKLLTLLTAYSTSAFFVSGFVNIFNGPKAPTGNRRFSLRYMWKEFGEYLAQRRGFESDYTQEKHGRLGIGICVHGMSVFLAFQGNLETHRTII